MYKPLSTAPLRIRHLGLAYAQRFTAAPRFLRYSVAASFFLIALFTRFELAAVLPTQGFPFLTFFPAVLIAAYLAGLGPGLFTSALSVLAAWYFFIQPDRATALTGPDMIALAFFSVILLIDCLVIHFMKSALVRVNRTEQQLRESGDRLRLVLNNLHMYVGILDLNGTLCQVNEDALQNPDASRKTGIGRPLWEASWWTGDVDRQNQVRAAIARAAVGETVRFDVEVMQSDQKQTIDFQVGPLCESDGKIIELVVSGVNVTARVEAVAELQVSRREALIAAEAAEAERRVLDATFNAVPAGIVVANADGKLLRMNRAIEKIWGIAPFSNDVDSYSQWKGWWADGSARHGQPLQSQDWAMARSLKGESCIDVVEVESFGFPGERRVTLVSSAPVLDPCGRVVGGVTAQIDISARIHAEKALRESEERFRALFNSGPIAIYSCDISGKIQEYNPCAAALWGWEPKHNHSDKKFSGAYRLYLPDGTFRSSVESPMAEVLRGEIPAVRDMEVIIERPDGSRITVITNIVPLKNAQGEITGAINCFYDITERSRLERKTQEQAQTLADIDRRKDEFLAMLSHELRNPLAPLANAAQLLRRQVNEDPLQQQARLIIERQIGQLNHLIDDLLEVSRITTGSVRLRQARITISDVVNRALEAAQPLIEQFSHELTVSLPGEPVFLHADAARLEQVLVNLLNNAAKYTEKGGHIWLSVEREVETVVISVRDTGIGISPELLPRIFELFTQAERSLDRSQGGLGIGLCLVRRLVELHGGSVEAYSVVGQGSKFVVRLPAMPMALPASTSPDLKAARLPEKVFTRCRVLVVDDNVDGAQSLSTLLELTGHEVFLAYDGPTALQTAIAYRPDVVLLDIGLPGLDGYEVAQRIRQDATLKGMVLVALTGYGQDADRQRSQDAGFNHHLVKPADFDEIEKILQMENPLKEKAT